MYINDCKMMTNADIDVTISNELLSCSRLLVNVAASESEQSITNKTIERENERERACTLSLSHSYLKYSPVT